MVHRHKTALRRTSLSRPIRLALASGLIHRDVTLLDYGCGRGDDVHTLAGLGYDCVGWDPAYQPDGELRPSEVVNLGYVVNVIEDPGERVETLRAAWQLTRRVLIVAARVDVQAQPNESEELADGVITVRGTFQKFYTQPELRDWIDDTLDVLSVAAAPGIFFVFRTEQDRQRFSSRLFRRQMSPPIGRVSDTLFDANRDLLAPLIDFFEARGRVPTPEEIASAPELTEVFGSIPRAFQVVRNATGKHAWNKVRDQRRDDLLVYLAMQRFRKRPKFSALPLDLRNDVRAFYGTYSAACTEADRLLFSAGQRELVDRACGEAAFGKLTPQAIYFHESGLVRMPPVLRALEGCARVMVGEVEGANLIKLRRDRPKVSYLSYPEFDEVAHPTLAFSVVVQLDTMVATFHDFSGRANPPILHRKETFVPTHYPRRQLFARLTRQEERRGLLNREEIGTRNGWRRLLDAEGLKVAGHVLRRR
ncbi:MAG: DNA phosphorothioation-associated putative methyltransferase [Gammaproteobacteria bacterium]|nr:DNA phosphorothioation-associated putative methyltransferase [Gammaproteobacteria bacterium]